MPFHIHGKLSQTSGQPSAGTEGPQGLLIPQQALGTSSWFLRFPPRLFDVCDALKLTETLLFNLTLKLTL